MFFLYGPQAPASFCKGPSCMHSQAEFIEKALGMLAKDNITRFEVTVESKEDWCWRMKEK